ncbi:ferritin-like domain-containing protein [Devosia sp. RR2S18]|jgi:ferritin-like metal-binding protein YciE|uniref:ferritin-like domain-containing protein n=1 Tax=Devosia rhizosphaerae TaxID=3049774 RepID=UPI00254000E8|nr:ferritin-like domain-containing protein [Devosia sp. RR2S18]WIJ24799.1 ferritin-like domain-containing protein [Devosia sp. RR2S18]HEV7290813.1 ferritin-like domain-containing protein [Devosia sp.]
MPEAREYFISGLKNAHAMENQALSIMRPQVSRIENYPEVAARLEQHIKETEVQIDRLERLLEGLGESNSGLKDMALSFSGSMAAIGHSAAPDEIVKNSFANYAFEHFEMAAYKSLLALSPHVGNATATELLTQSLEEEIAMADWVGRNIEPVTLQYVALREAGATAKK